MKLTYRPEIDGLRAIAVGAVILYHAQITILGYQPFKGGFIGVDIFFVISGYLITSIILKELVTTGSFSFKHFYERRVRRILPALLFVMLVFLPFAWMYLLPSSFVDFSKSILYSLGFSSNFYFHYSGQQYGAESGLLKPFLHTWSLSVEEQFYILFPIVLLITFKYFRKYLIHILILGFVISLGLAEWTSRNYPSTSFYFLHTRMWELLAGSILAYFEIIKGHRSKNKTLNLILPTTGLLLIGHSILFFNDEMFHPSFYTLSPIIGVCLIIWFSNKNELITKILSTKLFVGIGLISYSLYLWHYPIFAFNRITFLTRDNIFFKLLLILSVLVLSIFSYYFVEKPFRNKKNNIKNILILIFISSLILIFCNLYVVYNDGVKNRLPEVLEQNLREKNVNLHQKDNTQKIVLIGDSHSESLEFYLNEKIKKKDMSLFKFSTPMYLTDFNYVSKKNKKNR
jgi:peptidoglycan/LPS O-acetylase OafA/YrhL